MTEPIATVEFRTLATALLLTRRFEVEPARVHGVADQLVGTAARRTGLDKDEAVHLVTSKPSPNS